MLDDYMSLNGKIKGVKMRDKERELDETIEKAPLMKEVECSDLDTYPVELKIEIVELREPESWKKITEEFKLKMCKSEIKNMLLWAEHVQPHLDPRLKVWAECHPETGAPANPADSPPPGFRCRPPTIYTPGFCGKIIVRGLKAIVPRFQEYLRNESLFLHSIASCISKYPEITKIESRRF